MIPEPAGQMYAVALALDVAADHPLPKDVALLIEQGRGLAKAGPLPGRSTVLFRDAAAAFCRAAARHEPDNGRWIEAAEALELGRDMAIATMVPDDA